MSNSCDSIDCSLPGSFDHGIFQARILEWVAISLSRRSSQPRSKPRSPALQADSFFFFLNLIFLTLQYCIGFAIYQNESATGIHVFPIPNPPPSPYLPSGLSQCTSPKHPVSCFDETGAYYTEWSKPERKTPKQYTNTYIWNLERW